MDTTAAADPARRAPPPLPIKPQREYLESDIAAKREPDQREARDLLVSRPAL